MSKKVAKPRDRSILVPIRFDPEVSKILSEVIYEDRIKKLRIALEFYGNLDNYDKVDGRVSRMEMRGLRDRKLYKVLDFGATANEALEKDSKHNPIKLEEP
jgi:hypothetical protein